MKNNSNIYNISKKNKMIIAGILTIGVLVVGGTTVVRYETYQDLITKCKDNGLEDKYGDVGLFIKKSTLDLIETDLNNQIAAYEKTYQDLEKLANKYDLDITSILGDEKVRANQITLLEEALKTEEENRTKLAQEETQRVESERIAQEQALEEQRVASATQSSSKPSTSGSNPSGTNTTVTTTPPTNGGVPSWVVGVCSDYGFPIISNSQQGFDCATAFKSGVEPVGMSTFFNPDGSFDSIFAVFADGTEYSVGHEGWIGV
ncbi:MAG: hypothetical protein ACRC5R_00310 [Mycoplasmatales bacterium]